MRAFSLYLLFLTCAGMAQLKIEHVFPNPPKTIPLQILNTASDHFYMLRYNRLAHDITIEKRRKSDSGIAGFVPLKLDSVNASWFNYEELDRLFFEKNGILYFVFSRVLNNRSTLYMKVIDSSCRASGFIKIGSLEAKKGNTFLHLKFSLTPTKNVLIVKESNSGWSSSKEVQLYDPERRQMVVSRKLPAEGPETGYSQEHTFDRNRNLYFLLLRSRYNSMGAGDESSQMRRRDVDSVTLAFVSADGKKTRMRKLSSFGRVFLHSHCVVADSGRLALHLMYSAEDTGGKEKIFFAIWRFDKELNDAGFRMQELRDDLDAKLTYFDGTEYEGAARKGFSQSSRLLDGRCTWHLAERQEQNFNKEVLIWRTDNRSDKIELQQLLPRKSFFFPDRNPFRGLGQVMAASQGDTLYTFELEHRNNSGISLEDYQYHDLARQESLAGAELVMYRTVKGELHPRKKILFQNEEYSCVPLDFSGAGSEAIFYFIGDARESFIVSPLSQL